MLTTNRRKGGVYLTLTYMGCPGQTSVRRCHLSRDPKDERDEPREECKGAGEGPAF